jgi:hypothetical protein
MVVSFAPQNQSTRTNEYLILERPMYGDTSLRFCLLKTGGETLEKPRCVGGDFSVNSETIHSRRYPRIDRSEYAAETGVYAMRVRSLPLGRDNNGNQLFGELVLGAQSSPNWYSIDYASIEELDGLWNDYLTGLKFIQDIFNALIPRGEFDQFDILHKKYSIERSPIWLHREEGNHPMKADDPMSLIIYENRRSAIYELKLVSYLEHVIRYNFE